MDLYMRTTQNTLAQSACERRDLPKASLAASMVNFHDYSVIAQDTRAYDTVFQLSLAPLKFH